MAQTELAFCRHRGRKRSGVVSCASEHLVHPGTVPVSFCANQCPFVDRPNIETPAPKVLPVGDALHARLAAFGGKASSGCGCGDWIAAMNQNGLSWSRAHRDEIVSAIYANADKALIGRIGKTVGLARRAIALVVDGVFDSFHQLPTRFPESLDLETLQTEAIVWTYWDRGAEGDELRWSMESVARNVPGARIVLCGDRPKWYQGEFIHCPRISARKAGVHGFRRNIADATHKLLTIAQSGVCESFLWMHDDTFVLIPTSLQTLAVPRHNGKLTGSNKTTWRRIRSHTAEYLRGHGIKPKSYDTHYPTMFHCDTLARVITEHGLMKTQFAIMSLYHNLHPGSAAAQLRSFHYLTKKSPRVPDVAVLNVQNKAWKIHGRTIKDRIVER